MEEYALFILIVIITSPITFGDDVCGANNQCIPEPTRE